MARVLVVDDDELFVKLMVYALEERGHEVEFAFDGMAGSRAFSAARFHAVVCDLIMPDQEGLETIRHMRREDPQVGIVAISSGMKRAPDIDVLHFANQLGADVTLRKPFKLSQLTTAVDTAIAAHAPSLQTTESPVPGAIAIGDQ
jgi:DNA-binding response OmpR family regulator